MNIAVAVRKRANCCGRRVGAVLVRNERIVSTGYNGTPEGMTNCEDGGCVRCSDADMYKAGEGYDVCICVHAEQNALLSAARFGIAVEGAIIYTTIRPCFGCAKELLQARVLGIRFLHSWSPRTEPLLDTYLNVLGRFPDGVVAVPFDDPDQVWAMRPRRLHEQFVGE